jgi:hypothetical protein
MSKKIPGKFLGILHLFIGINALGGGIYGLAGAKDVPLSLLNGTPFNSFFIPSLILVAIVSTSCLFAGIALLKNLSFASRASFIAGIILLTWISVQVVLIGYISWMQPAIGFAAVFILFLSHKLQQDNYGINHP